jgi:hypothetical protein
MRRWLVVLSLLATGLAVGGPAAADDPIPDPPPGPLCVEQHAADKTVGACQTFPWDPGNNIWYPNLGIDYAYNLGGGAWIVRVGGTLFYVN